MRHLEEVIGKHIEPVVDEAMQKFLGIRIAELKGDISDKILSSPLLGLPISFEKTYREAKKEFKKAFMSRLLQLHHGNISQVARISGMNRRSIHRMLDKEVTQQVRKELLKPYYLKQQEIEEILGTAVNQYKSVLRDEKIEAFYLGLENLSKDIVDYLPEEELTLKEAEELFDKRYLLHHLQMHQQDLQKTAKAIALRYETLLRKLRTMKEKETANHK